MAIRNQSFLGSIERETKKSQDMRGMLFYGKVIKVYPKNHSADVELWNSQYGKIVSSANNNGKFACKILEPLAGVDPDTKNVFGVSHPIQIGSFVVVGFLSNFSAQPIILGSIFPSEDKNIIDDNSEYSYLSVTAKGDYSMVSDSGEFEAVSHNGTFATTSIHGIDEEELSESTPKLSDKYPITNGGTLSFGMFFKTLVGNIKIVANSIKGTLKLINTVNSKSSFIGFNDDGSVEIGTKSEQSTSIKIDPNDNSIELSQNEGMTKILISQDGSVNISTKNTVDVDAKSSVSIKSSSHIGVRGSSISLKSNSHTISL